MSTHRFTLAVLCTALAAAVPAGASAAARPDPGHATSAARFSSCAGTPLVHPREFNLFCGDGNDTLSHLIWSHWGSATATATGTETLNTCDPDCAAGHLRNRRVRIAVSGLSGGRYRVLRVGRERFALTRRGPALA